MKFQIESWSRFGGGLDSLVLAKCRNNGLMVAFYGKVENYISNVSELSWGPVICANLEPFSVNFATQ